MVLAGSAGPCLGRYAAYSPRSTNGFGSTAPHICFALSLVSACFARLTPTLARPSQSGNSRGSFQTGHVWHRSIIQSRGRRTASLDADESSNGLVSACVRLPLESRFSIVVRSFIGETPLTLPCHSCRVPLLLSHSPFHLNAPGSALIVVVPRISMSDHRRVRWC